VGAACARGERAFYFAFEESPDQIQRNMEAVGIKLAPYIRKGLLRILAARPTDQGLEMHLIRVHEAVRLFQPKVVVFDPITNLIEVGSLREVKSMLTRLIDFLKLQKITALFTSLTAGGADPDKTEVGISSVMDAWLVVRNLESGGERNRALYVLKARGLAHSNQVREFILSSRGLDLVDVALEGGEVLVGGARLAREARLKDEALAKEKERKLRELSLQRERRAIEAQIAALRAELQLKEKQARMGVAAERLQEKRLSEDRLKMARQRSADPVKAR
jgi:circadian clock protein KaiC